VAVQAPCINLEEQIDRQVGRRTRQTDGLQTGLALQALGAQLHRSFKHRWCPKGVYRFKTHEEADAWTMKMLARSGM
jgi:predicted transcriptional regulator